LEVCDQKTWTAQHTRYKTNR